MNVLRRFFRNSIFVLFFFSLSFAGADSWTLAAQKFNFSQKGIDSASAVKISTVLPKLILEQIAQKGIRTVSFQEQLDRELYTLQTERLSLILQLSKERKTRDALVLSKDKPGELKKTLKEQEKKIQEIESKIDENLKTVESTIEKYEKQIQLENKNPDNERRGGHFAFGELPFKIFGAEEERIEKQTENIELYKSDNTKLFEPSATAAEGGIESYAFAKEVIAAKVNGLITGEITFYGEYVSVTTKLYVFPGAKCTATVTEVGNSNDLIAIAQNIARSLTPGIANSIPVKIKVEIEPKEARKTAIVSVDGVIVPSDEEIVVNAGVHSLSVSAQGFEKQTINYSFSGEELFTVQTTLLPLVLGSLDIRLKKMSNGVFYFNALDSDSVDEQNEYANAKVNGKSILSIYKNQDGASAFVYIPYKLAQDGQKLVVNAKPYDRAQNIDKRRKGLYRAYSVLICSLIPTFYTVGNFTSLNNSYASGGASYAEVSKWQQYSYYTVGISCAAGAWSVFELIRYLKAANEVLPANAKVQKK